MGGWCFLTRRSWQAARMGLPVCGMEQEIVEAVNKHDVVILCGEGGEKRGTERDRGREGGRKGGRYSF